MASRSLQCRLAPQRVAAGLTQDSLAARVGVSRQALGLIEAGRSIPSTALALRLARALGSTVEQLFSLDDEPPATIAAHWVTGGPAAGRGVLGQVGQRLVVQPLEARALDAADVLRGEGKRPSTVLLDASAPERARRRLLIAGCAPALGLLVSRLARAPGGVGFDAVWSHATTQAALAQLERGETHAAGVHFPSPPRRHQRSHRPQRILTFARWQQGLLLRRGDRQAPRTIAELGRKGLRLARREAGASANRLLDERLAAAGVRFAGRAIEVRGHFGVAEAIALGAADVGVAAQHAALAHGLDFVPLDEERFDLVFHGSLADDPLDRVARLGDVLTSRAFRADLERLGGYDSRESGDEVVGAQEAP
jgi:putative molybdopterin biosynthesis protein